jgi:hypothetical protein
MDRAGSIRFVDLVPVERASNGERQDSMRIVPRMIGSRCASRRLFARFAMMTPPRRSKAAAPLILEEMALSLTSLARTLALECNLQRGELLAVAKTNQAGIEFPLGGFS